MNINWDLIDTVLLDMDGTLLDLRFDNYFWHEIVPTKFANKHGIGIEEANLYLKPLFKKMEGSLNWYCLDYWTKELDIDILRLKRDITEHIKVLPHVYEFLIKLNYTSRNVLLVTNAHRDSLNLKLEKTKIDFYFDQIISSHDYGVPKEDNVFWQKLQQDHLIDLNKTILFDDSLAVLDAAQNFGIKNLIFVSKPDSSLPSNFTSKFTYIDDFSELINRI